MEVKNCFWFSNMTVMLFAQMSEFCYRTVELQLQEVPVKAPEKASKWTLS